MLNKKLFYRFICVQKPYPTLFIAFTQDHLDGYLKYLYTDDKVIESVNQFNHLSSANLATAAGTSGSPRKKAPFLPRLKAQR